jgi:hypothetical protein
MRCAPARADGAALGLMLHHAVMAEEELRALAAFLEVAADHPGLRWRGMRELLVLASTDPKAVGIPRTRSNRA